MATRHHLRSAPARRPPAHHGPAVATGTLPRRYQVVDGDSVLGWSLLERRFPERRMAAGYLNAFPIFDIYRALFATFREAASGPAQLRDYVRRRNRLGLQLVEVPGGVIPGQVEWISDWENGRSVLHVSTDYAPFWDLAP